ncbi:MAG: shikimate kinase [Lachnospiraceae bacterium]|nr:shikimate kinase [Lachnospiraceae bacterium]
MSLILEGFMGSGKSAVGRMLARKTGTDLIDTDAEIEKRQQKSIPEIFERSGEEAFRQMETSMLQGLLLSDVNAVISLGGGTPVREANRSYIRQLGKVIYLKASADILINRLRRGVGERPMLAGGDLETRVHELLEKRESAYLSLADEVIEVFEDDVTTVCGRIMERCGDTAGSWKDTGKS